MAIAPCSMITDGTVRFAVCTHQRKNEPLKSVSLLFFDAKSSTQTEMRHVLHKEGLPLAPGYDLLS